MLCSFILSFSTYYLITCCTSDLAVLPIVVTFSVRPCLYYNLCLHASLLFLPYSTLVPFNMLYSSLSCYLYCVLTVFLIIQEGSLVLRVDIVVCFVQCQYVAQWLAYYRSEMSLHWNMSGVFLMIKLVFRKKTIEVKYSYHGCHIKGTYYQYDFSVLKLTLTTWLR